MRIVISLFRPWSAVHSYRSFIENAQRLGHEIVGVGPKPDDRQEPMMEAVLAPMNLKCWPVHQIEEALREKPDVIYGEAINEPYEVQLQEWAAEHGVRALVLEHGHFLGPPVSERCSQMKDIPNSTLLVANHRRVLKCKAMGIEAMAIGVPDLDLIKPMYDTTQSRDRLGIPPGQKVIAFFIGLWWQDLAHLQDEEEATLHPFMKVAKREGWHVLIHCHASERVMPSSPDPEGLLFPQRYPYLKQLQDMGGRFVTSFAPGTVGEIEFDLCDGYELMAMADCIVATYRTIAWKAYAMGYKYVMIHNEKLVEYERTLPYELPLANVREDHAPYEVIRSIVTGNEPKTHHRPDHITKTWYHALDGKCWERMLGAAGG